jgi:Rha family phage regulatory protein
MKPSGRHENKPLVVKHEGKPYVRSTNFAKVFERRHSHVLESIKTLQIRQPKSESFRLANYLDLQKKPRPEFLISEEGFRLLTQSYQTEDQQKRIRQYQIQFNQHRKAEKPSKFSSLIKPMDNWNWAYIAYPTEGNGNGHGYIVGEVYINCFWYYVKPGNIVVDPMAGSGMAKRIYDDRAFWMGEHLYDFELHLLRNPVKI